MTISGEAIHLRDWITARAATPPSALAQRLAEIVGDDICENPDALPEALISRAERLLTRTGNDRSSAADLLAADALITYAMEAAAEYRLDVDAIASSAATRLAAVPSSGAQP